MTTRNIGELRKLSALKKAIYSDSLQDKIARDSTQFRLKETFKPLLSGQESQLNETKNIVNKQDEIARQKELTTQQKHQELIAEIKSQPLIVPLIQSLDNYPEVVRVIKGETDGANLTGQEQHVLRELEGVDDRILRTLIQYYETVKNEKKLVSLEPHPADIVGGVDPPPRYKEDEFESSNATSYKRTYNNLKMRNNLKDNIGFYITAEIIKLGEYPVLFSDNQIKLLDNDSVYNYTSGLQKLLSVPKLNVLAKSNRNITEDDVHMFLNIIKESGTDITQWQPDYISSNQGIKINTALQKIGALNDYFPDAHPYTSHSGEGVKDKFVHFLTSDPKELFNKLNILIAEKDAGHTNVLTEATAIVDELRRLGLLTIAQIKKIYKLIV